MLSIHRVEKHKLYVKKERKAKYFLFSHYIYTYNVPTTTGHRIYTFSAIWIDNIILQFFVSVMAIVV
jgi:hypothetical protein